MYTNDEKERHRQLMHHRYVENLNKQGSTDMNKDKTDKVKKYDSSPKKMNCDVQKFAMGGVGKIRHKEATKSGKPIKLKKD